MEQKNTNKNKIINFLIGDIEKWKKMPEAFKELREDLKNPKKSFRLILISITVLGITMTTMYLINDFQKSAQYCAIGKEITPEMNLEYSQSYKEILKDKEQLYYYTIGGNKQLYSIICKWDIKRYWNEKWK